MVEPLVLHGLLWVGALQGAEVPPAIDRQCLVPVQRSALRFIENRGQWPASVQYVAPLPGQFVRAECDGLAFDHVQDAVGGRGVLVRLRFEGVHPGTAIEGCDRLPGTYNYFLGNDPSRWVSDVPSFAAVRYRGLYAGIDLVLHAGELGVKYDLLVEPHADLAQVALRWEGIDEQALEQGQWSGETGTGVLAQLPARCFELHPTGEPRELQCTWTMKPDRSVRLDVPDWNPEHALVVDPELLWSTYLGSPHATSVGDWAEGIAYDPTGNVVVIGRTTGWGFPQTPGAYQFTPTLNTNLFATKFRQSDGGLVYSSVFGGSTQNQQPYDVAVGLDGAATVVGWTIATDYPTTPGAFDRVNDSGYAGFVTRLSATGNALVYSTFLEDPQGAMLLKTVCVDSSNRAVVAGGGYLTAPPTTPGAFRTATLGDGRDSLVARLNPSGSAMEWSTLMGGSTTDDLKSIALDPSGDVLLVGITLSDDFPTTLGAFQTTRPGWLSGFLTRLSAQGDRLMWSTYFGGAPEVYIWSAAIDWQGAVYFGGYTKGFGLPTTPGVLMPQNPVPPGQNDVAGFVGKLDPLGQSLIYSTYYAGPSHSTVAGLWVDPSGVLTFGAGGIGIPMTPGSFDTTSSQGGGPGVARLSPQADRVFYATYLDGPGTEALEGFCYSPTGRVSVAGYCFWPGGWPTTTNAFQPNFVGGQMDAVVATLDLYLQGVESSGSSIPSCHGPLIANATEMPVAGSASFSLYCSGAPPLGAGWLLMSAAHAGPAPAGPGGVPMMAGLVLPSTRIPVVADGMGYVETSLPLPVHWTGRQLQCVYVFANTPWCTGPRRTCASNALTITVQ